MYIRRELDAVDLSDTLMRIIGEIEPTGNHEVDKQRLQNLYRLCRTIDCLLYEIMELMSCKDRAEASMNEIRAFATTWLTDKSVWIRDMFEIAEHNI